MEGAVLSYNAEKNFGFVSSEGGGDYIFHLTDEEIAAGIPGWIVGSNVRYRVGPDKHGAQIAFDLRAV